MMRRLCVLALLAAAASLTWTVESGAGDRRASARVAAGQGIHVLHRGRYSRRAGTRVRGFSARRGGYSYTPEDVINTYGDSRTIYGSVNFYRDPFVDRQTRAGPFDHGFFFDSGIAPRGGDSPYMN